MPCHFPNENETPPNPKSIYLLTICQKLKQESFLILFLSSRKHCSSLSSPCFSQSLLEVTVFQYVHSSLTVSVYRARGKSGCSAVLWKGADVLQPTKIIGYMDRGEGELKLRHHNPRVEHCYKFYSFHILQKLIIWSNIWYFKGVTGSIEVSYFVLLHFHENTKCVQFSDSKR